METKDAPRPGDLCIASLVAEAAARGPRATAILAPGRAPLTFSELYHHIDNVRRTLRAVGVGRNDRVAAVLPGGPEAAVAFVAISASATYAPLNPAYQADEFDFYLSDINAQALIISAELDSPARDIARGRGIPVVEIMPDVQGGAGVFSLGGNRRSRSVVDGFARSHDTALVLHTSGTTARPKKVPLTHANICASAGNIVSTLGLTRRDRCLNIMPLYHIHGLIAATLSTLAAGGSVICPSGFDPIKFFAWLEDFRPSWYTAAPTLHQAILSHAKDHLDVVRHRSLRFIRSCSAPLPPQITVELERTFDAPVIEAYGMTEAAHQVSSNPLPPRTRKIGSVGLATGPEVSIIDETGRLLPPGAVGEIVIRGPNVIQGYEDNPSANMENFGKGWFKTGDQGLLDADGYLFIKGRLKEIINRGGEKISPREVDEVLLDHPAVAQAVTFSLPHVALGEDVAAAVVLHKNTSATEADIRRYAATRVAEFKVPCRVLILRELPKGPTGKLRRVNLAEHFAPLLKTEFVTPTTSAESKLARIWSDVLGAENVGIDDNFFELGGTSLTAVRMFAEIREVTGQNLPLTTLLQAPTVRQLAQVISQPQSPTWTSLVTIQSQGSRPPFFLMHSVGGTVLYYRDLAQCLGPDQPVYALQQQGLDGVRPLHTRIEEMAEHYVKEMRSLVPEGSYFLGGHSLGGLIAYEVAQQLTAQGGRVALLALIDTYFPNTSGTLSNGANDESDAKSLLRKMRFHLDNLVELEPRDRLTYVIHRLDGLRERFSRAADMLFKGGSERRRQSTDKLETPLSGESYALFRKVEENNRAAASAYVPRGYPGRVTVFLTKEPQALGLLRSRRMPEKLAAGGLESHRIPGGHATILEAPHVRLIGVKLRTSIEHAIESVGDASSPRARANPTGVTLP